MTLFSVESITIITIVIYLLATIMGIAGMIMRRQIWCSAGCWLALGAFFCQTFALVMGFHKSPTGSLSIGAYLQMLAWFFLLCGIAAWWRLRQDSLILFAAPLGLILFLMSASSLHVPVRLPESLTSSFYVLHIGSLFLCMGFLCVAFIAGLIFLVIQKRIKRKQMLRGMWRDMPSLSLLDKINFSCSIAAFPLYTTGILAGIFWARPVFGSTLSGDPKEIASIFIWILLAILFHNRLAKGWNGRKPALLAIFIFVLSILSIMIINFYVPSHHAFVRN